MPALPNPKHERFAQELAKGKTATEAMEASGYSDPRNSTRLTKNDEIAARVAELQNRSAARTEITIESLLREAGEIQTAAGAAGQHSAAIAALTAKAKLAGLWVDKAENTNRNVDARSLSDAELTAAVVEGDRSAGTASPPSSTQKPH